MPAPVHVPVVALYEVTAPVVPTVSTIAGRTLFAGMLLDTGGDAIEVAGAEVPDAFEALTTTLSVFPTSADVGENVSKIAPAMSTQRAAVESAALPLVREHEVRAGPRAGRGA